MSESERKLPRHVVSLVHHAELHKHEWWRTANDRLVQAALYASDNNALSTEEIADTLRSEIGAPLPPDKVAQSVDRLLSKHQLTSSGGKYSLSTVALEQIDKEIEEALATEDRAKREFTAIGQGINNEIDWNSEWTHFVNGFLNPLIRELGAATFRLLTGKSDDRHSEAIDQFIEKRPEDNREAIRSTIVRFANQGNPHARRYILQALNSQLYLEATRVPQEAINHLRETQSKKHRKLRVLLDTNVVLALLGLQSTSNDSASIQLPQTLRSLDKTTIAVSLCITQETVDELRSLLSAVASGLRGKVIPENIAEGVRRRKINSVAASYFDHIKNLPANEPRPSAEEYFSPYIENTVATLKGKGIELFAGAISHVRQQQPTIDDVAEWVENEESRPEDERKPYPAILHDVTLWHSGDFLRDQDAGTAIDANVWICTLDGGLIRFDRQKKRNSVPICIHPASLLQLLRFFVPTSEEIESGIVDSVWIPAALAAEVENSEDVVLRIAGTLSRYQNATNLSIEDVEHILTDKALQARMRNIQDDEEELSAVHDSILRQNIALREGKDRAERETASKQAENLILSKGLEESQAESRALMVEGQELQEALSRKDWTAGIMAVAVSVALGVFLFLHGQNLALWLSDTFSNNPGQNNPITLKVSLSALCTVLTAFLLVPLTVSSAKTRNALYWVLGPLGGAAFTLLVYAL